MRLATVSRLVDLCMERLTLGKKNHTRTHMCNTCAHAYVRTCVRSYVRMCVRTYVRINARTHVCIWVRIWCFPTWAFPRKGLYESLRYRHASRYRGLPHVRTHVACTHVRMYAHMSTCMMFSQREPSHACLCELRYRSLPLASDPFKKRTSLCVSLVLPRPHTTMGQNRINKFFWQNWRRFCIFSTTCADSGCQNVKKSNQNRKKSGQKPSIRTCVHVHTYILYLV